MGHPLVRRQVYSLLTVLAGLSLHHYITFVAPDPAKWMYNMTASGFAPFMTAITFVVFGAPAWVLTYLLFGLLGIPNSGRPRSRDDAPPAG